MSSGTSDLLPGWMHHLPQMIVVLDAERLTIVDVNPVAERLLGKSRAELVGTLPETTRDQARAALQSRLPIDGPEEQIETALGPRWLQTKHVPLFDAGGAATVIVAITEDLTDRKHAEAALQTVIAYSRRTELLAENNARELASFSYSVSHDLRAPLRGIDGFSRILLESHAAQLDERGRHYLDRVRAATQRMSTQIDDLLELSRVTRAELRCQPTELDPLVRQVIAELLAKHPDRQIAVSVELNVTVDGDPTLLRALFGHLLSNAWKFTSKNPDAAVQIGIGLVAEGMVEVYVRDNGVGFDQAYSSRLFGAFQRLHTQTEFDGVGVGLATAQRIVHRHGGAIRAEAEVGKGATFFFTLPVKR